MNANVIAAIFKRNLVSYFSSPTGYLFICVFVGLGGLAAFWDDRFFAANLANLDQLNSWLPWIMLVFVPTITMSIWAEERRQGTDELLLTIPASDLDVVLGKYLAAVGIFVVALAFSFISNFLVLVSLGEPDGWLFMNTYFGYLLVGMAMLSIGMVGSFLTSNLTVGFVLGALLNAPLVLLGRADAMIPRSDIAISIKQFGISANFAEFGRGVLSISAIIYFLSIIIVMLYVSVILIGRRHWLGGRDGHSMLGHYILRAVALVIGVCGVTFFFRNHDFLRADLTKDKLNSMSHDSLELVRNLEPKHTIRIDAYISPNVPEAYVQTRLTLIAMLQELKQQGGDNIQVKIYDTEPFSDAARQAELNYGIERHSVQTESRGVQVMEDVFLGAVFRSGLDSVVVPFFGLGIPVEYELIRSVCTVGQPKRLKLGVVTTDAGMMGGFGVRPQLIVEELKKQYEVIEVDPNSKIVDSTDSTKDQYDVLLVVQPSSLTPAQLPNLLGAIKAGVPTAIFEDPFPFWMRNVPGTSQPKRPPQSMMMMMRPQRPEPKCDIQQLWDLLGVRMLDKRNRDTGKRDALIVWQAFNPYPKLRQRVNITNEWVFASRDASGGAETFNPESSITSGFRETLMLLPGSISKAPGSDLEFTKLITMGDQTGTIEFQSVAQHQGDVYELRSLEKATGESYTLAAHIQGTLSKDELDETKSDDAKDDDGKDTDKKDTAKKEPKHTAGELNAVVVMDIDMLESNFVRLRAEPIPELDLHFQNVPFVLNVLDTLAGEERFINLRKRQLSYPTLSKVEAQLNAIRKENEDAIEEYRKDFNAEEKKAEKAKDEAIKKFQTQLDEIQGERPIDYKKLEAATYKIQITTRNENMREAVKKESLKRERDEKIKRNNEDLALRTRVIQVQYKVAAIVLPPLLPFVLAVSVFFWRRSRESEGVSPRRMHQ
jgi:ABC-2 type transport system permease protein